MLMEKKEYSIMPNEFIRDHKDKCAYEVDKASAFSLKITEYAPRIFKKLRGKFGKTGKEMLKDFWPQNNWQAIHNFQIGSGQGGSFFLFTDSKNFCMKTMK
jgi:hypothetical protein